MNKIKISAIILTILCLSVSCKKEIEKQNYITLSAESVQVPRIGKNADGTNVTFSIKSNTYWRAFIPADCDWVTFYPKASSDPEVEVSLVVETNTKGSKREATIAFEDAGSVKTLLRVIQNGEESAPRINVMLQGKSWTQNDTILLMSKGFSSKFYYRDGSFTSDNDLPEADKYAVVYPYDDKASFDGTSVTLALNKEQKFKTEYGSNDAARYSDVASGSDFTLKPLFGSLRVNLTGKGTVNVLSFSSSQDKLTVIPDQGVTLSSQPESVDFVLSPASRTDCKIGVTDASGDEVLYDIDDFGIAEGQTQTVNIKHESTSSYVDLNSKAYYGESGQEKVYANCYMITKAGDYKFAIADATGVSVSYTDVTWVWATTGVWNSVVSCSLDNLITDISVKNGCVLFTIPEDFTPGNVILAAIDNKGAIQCSWHVWTTVDYEDIDVQGVKWMDRNIGASYLFNPTDPEKCNAARGFYYDWGCKNPIVGLYEGVRGSAAEDIFTMGVGATYYIYNINVKNTGEWSVMTEYPEGWSGSVEEAAKYPMVHFSGTQAPTAGQSIDWPDNANPCPYGYKVMSCAQATALGTLQTMTTVCDKDDNMKNVASVNGGVNFPSCGYRNTTGNIKFAGNPDGRYWTKDSKNVDRKYNWTMNRSNFKQADANLGTGMSVRCVKTN